jgi:hypothetical protein
MLMQPTSSIALQRLSNAAIFDLPFGDHVHELEATRQDTITTKILESEHRSSPLLERSMILFDDVV